MFTANHVILLISCAALIVLSTLLSVRYRLSLRKAAIIFTVICVCSEIIKDMVNMVPSEFGGAILDHEDIPLHLCSLVLFAMLIAVFAGQEKTKNTIFSFVAVTGLTAPVFALLLPTEGVSFDDVQTYQYFIYHSALMWFALHGVISGAIDMGLKAYRRNIGCALVLFFLMIYVNSLLSAYDVNFCFVRKPPMEGLPFLNLDHGWYCYFMHLIVLVFTLITLVQLPFMLRERMKKDGRKSEDGHQTA